MNRKPEIRVIVFDDGSIRIVGSTAAAKFCGTTQQAFDRCVRRQFLPPRRPAGYKTVEERVREAYPELFNISDEVRRKVAAAKNLTQKDTTRKSRSKGSATGKKAREKAP